MRREFPASPRGEAGISHLTRGVRREIPISPRLEFQGYFLFWPSFFFLIALHCLAVLCFALLWQPNISISSLSTLKLPPKYSHPPPASTLILPDKVSGHSLLSYRNSHPRTHLCMHTRARACCTHASRRPRMCMHTRARACTRVHARPLTPIHVHAHACTCVHACARTPTHVHTCPCTCVHVRARVCTHAHPRPHTCMHMRARACTRVHARPPTPTHVHAHACTCVHACARTPTHASHLCMHTRARSCTRVHAHFYRGGCGVPRPSILTSIVVAVEWPG